MSDPKTRGSDWDEANLIVSPPRGPVLESGPAKSVRYERDRVIAYVDDLGRPAEPSKATFARVWDRSGRRLVRLAPK